MKKKSAEIGTIVLINLETNEVSVTAFSTYELAREKYEKWRKDDEKIIVEEDYNEYTYAVGCTKHRCVLCRTDIFNHSEGYVEERVKKLDF